MKKNTEESETWGVSDVAMSNYNSRKFQEQKSEATMSTETGQLKVYIQKERERETYLRRS